VSASTAGSLLAGRYQLEAPLGRGGFGQVWRARDVATRRPVAVKLVALAEITDPALLAETIARFRREAATVAALKHPNIVTAMDAGRVGGELFLVMELAEGASLATFLEQRAARGMGLFPVASVLDIAEQVCAGLGAAHAAGVVHRDIKPGNLMVAAQLRVKIIDFGIVRLIYDNAPRLTLPTLTIGTAAYMSPEQAGGGYLDGRADLYSFGCVLYQLLAGAPPFTAADAGALIMMQLYDQAIPLSARRGDLPAGLSELVGDLLAKDRAARPADAWQVIARIGAIRAALAAEGDHGGAPVHEADRATVLKSDLLAETARDDARADGDVAGPLVYSRTVTSLPPGTGSAGPGPGNGVGVGAQGTSGTAPGWPQPAPGTSGAVPNWPQPAKRRPRRRRWRTAVSTLITAAILAGAGAYAWERTHQPPLKVVSVAVALAQPLGHQCDVTADVIGTIRTNGHGGQVSYQWEVHDATSTSTTHAATITVASGQSTTQVHLPWTLNGPVTDHVTAEFRVLSPEPTTAQTGFTYSCAQ
jgi:hypothetical protein